MCVCVCERERERARARARVCVRTNRTHARRETVRVGNNNLPYKPKMIPTVISSTETSNIFLPVSWKVNLDEQPEGAHERMNTSVATKPCIPSVRAVAMFSGLLPFSAASATQAPRASFCYRLS